MYSAKALAVGFAVVAATIVVFVVVKAFIEDVRIAALVFAAVLMSPVILGFLLPIQRFLVMYLPSFSTRGELMPGVWAQPYPQIYAFRTELRNLPLLLIPALLPLVMAALMFSEGSGESDLVGRVVGYGWQILLISWAVALLMTRWVRERVLLRGCTVCLGMVVSQPGERELGYWFYDDQRNRVGGIAPYYPWTVLKSPLVPIFVNPKNWESHKPGFAFMFHRFVVTDARHLPAALLTQFKTQHANVENEGS